VTTGFGCGLAGERKIESRAMIGIMVMSMALEMVLEGPRLGNYKEWMIFLFV